MFDESDPYTPSIVSPTAAEIELSFRRSQLRRRVLIMLCSLSEATPRALALAAGVDAGRLRQALHGKLPFYRPELSLVVLGLVEVVETANGRVLRITERGRRKARQLTARVARRAEVRAMRNRSRMVPL